MSELRRSFYKDNISGKVKVVNNKKECIVTVALQGFSEQEILIKLVHDNLEISAQHSITNNSHNEDNKDIADKQSQEKIKYTIAVPINIDRNNVTAQLENGLLTVKFSRIMDQTPIEPKEISID
ncbi:small heat shock protein C1-like [Hydra vulgaris]|uniref:Small heat shock protein C1-like n=1 Tax=Hydra vulgaris TaxID=6087 RepID=A0ABM4DLW0_HYDVU